MAVKVKPLSDVVKKWGDVTPGRSSYYESEASVAGEDWERGAAAASKAYRAAVQAGNIEALFTGGIKKAGAAKYNRKVKDVGVARFGPGITAALPDYESGVSPMLDTIRALTLTTRGPRGSDINYNRVKEVGTALAKKRLALRAAGS